MISNKAKYGLKAVIFLAKHAEDGPILIADLAKKERLPQKFLEAILLELKKSGVLLSKKGKGGGYLLSRPANGIMVGEIIRVLDGALTPEANVFNDQCEIDVIMKEVGDAVSNVLDRTSLKDVIERVSLGKEVLNFMI